MQRSKYRRRTDRLKWHSNPRCPKWPTKHFVEDEPTGPMAQMMICPICKKLDPNAGQQKDDLQGTADS